MNTNPPICGRSLIPSEPVPIKLSICISTFNRATFIGATLESIINQAPNDCEIVVLDAASTDDTERVVSHYLCQFDRLRYFRQVVNNGIDQDYDRAVELARGEYCWLMTDDDHLKCGALTTVLRELRKEPSLILVNAECRDMDMSTVLLDRRLNISSNGMYSPLDMDRLFIDTGILLTFIGCVILKRAIWLARQRRRYFGSLFIHVGIIFQERLPEISLVVADPLVIYRIGNPHTFSSKLFESMMISWPAIVWSLAISESAKIKVCRAEPWRSGWSLLQFRAIGNYSLREYRSLVRPRVRNGRRTIAPGLVALLPGVMVNTALVLLYSIAGRERHAWLRLLRGSPFYFKTWLTNTRGR
jgi:abequosyltransferase